LNNFFRVLIFEAGYYHEQATKPQTLGYALADSPIGLLSWITEKFYLWSDNRNDDKDNQLSHNLTWISKDELLTNVMIYYLTGTITSSMRLYYEFSHNDIQDMAQLYIQVPTAVAVFPYELTSSVPRSWVEYMYNIKRWTEYSRGGHFALMERTSDLVNEIRLFTSQIQKIEDKDL